MRIKSHKNYFTNNQNDSFRSSRFTPKPWWAPQQQSVAVAQPVSAKLLRLQKNRNAATAPKPKAAKAKRTTARAKKR